MASDLSTYLGNKIIRWLAGNAMPTAPSSIYLALFNGDPKGAGSEITTSVRSAGRVAVSVAEPAAGSDNDMVTDADVDFGASENGSLSLSHVGIYDAASSGNLLATKQLTGGPFAISAGTLVNFVAGDITFTIGS